jgi:flagellar biogenesis protein FliO
MTAYMIETLGVLIVVCALAFAVLRGARRLGVGRGRGPIELAGYLPLDARRAIYLVRVGSQVLVVGAGEGGLTRIGETIAADLPTPETPQVPFTEVLWRRLKGETAP